LLPGGDVDVGAVQVRVCFAGTPPARVVPEHADALGHLIELPVVVDPAGHVLGRLPLDDSGLHTSVLRPGLCAGYTVDVEGLARTIDRHDLAQIVGRSVLLSPDVWLWRPAPLSSSRGRLVVKNGGDSDGPVLSAALPFVVDERGGFVVPASTFAVQSFGALGALAARTSTVTRAGTTLRVVWLNDSTGLLPSTLSTWLQVAVDDVAAVTGAFPVPEVLVLVAPRGGSRAVLGGFLGRGGDGASMVFHVGRGPLQARDDPGSDDIDSDGRWVLTHELAHTLLPPVARGDAWFNEGLTTWEQEMLPVRAGRRTRTVAQQELALGLAAGAARAQDDGLVVERACNEMNARHSYQHCYWAGAAMAMLVADRLGDDAVFALIAALSQQPFAGTPRRAVAVLESVVSSSSSPQAVQAAKALLQVWQQQRGVPFPQATDDGTSWPAAVEDSAP
jgi:hypothetical protein